MSPRSVLDDEAESKFKTSLTLRWLYTISSVFAGSDIYIFLDVLILSTRGKYLGSNIV